MARAHLVLDSERKALHRGVAYFEKQRQKLHNAEHEARSRHAAAIAPDGEFKTDTLEAVLGKPLHHNELIRKLRQCNPNLYFELSQATNRYGIYYPDREAKGTPTCPGVRYLGVSIESGFTPEFTPKMLKNDGNLLSVRHGYRTVLARLLHAGVISLGRAEAVFGTPSRTSKNWKQATT